MLGLTKEESRISLIGVVAALLGSLIGSVTGIWGTYAKFGADKKAQIKADRYRAYTQLKAQQAEFLMLFQALALADDKSTFYQVREAQQIAKDDDRGKSQGRKEAHDITPFAEVYASDALQQERNSEHYLDELVACSGKMFESIGLTQLSFPPDAALSEKTASVESMLSNLEDIWPRESLKTRVIWALTAEDSEELINTRQKQKMPHILKAIAPLTDLLNYLQERIRNDSQ